MFKFAFYLLCLNVIGLAGGYWDVWWHVAQKVETFYTLPHLFMYSAIALTGLSVLFIVLAYFKRTKSFATVYMPHAKGLALVGTGALFQLLAGGADNLYHNLVGFDVTIWSPPHLLAVFGVAFQMIGVYSLFRTSDSRYASFGCILAIGLGFAAFQFAVSEYEIIKDLPVIHNRWENLIAYYPIILVVPLGFFLTLSQKHISYPIGTAVTSVGFVLKLMVFGAWLLTSYHFLFPALVMLGGLFYDLLYLGLKKRTKHAHYYALNGLGIGLVLAVFIQSPVPLKPALFLFAVLGACIVSVISSFLVHGDWYSKLDQSYTRIAVFLITFFFPIHIYAHNEAVSRIAPEMHPIGVLLEWIAILVAGEFIAKRLSSIQSKESTTPYKR